MFLAFESDLLTGKGSLIILLFVEGTYVKVIRGINSKKVDFSQSYPTINVHFPGLFSDGGDEAKNAHSQHGLLCGHSHH